MRRRPATVLVPRGVSTVERERGPEAGPCHRHPQPPPTVGGGAGLDQLRQGVEG
jgi:hypothetical protein